MATITRTFEFDSAHRVMNEKVKCYNLHGHRFKVDVEFEFHSVKALGYTIDFKELKRVVGTFLDEHWDHASLLNPRDEDLIRLCQDNNWNFWVMGMGNKGDYNPSAEFIAYELLHICNLFFRWDKEGVAVSKIRLYETPNCWVDMYASDINNYYSPTKDVTNYLEDWRAGKGEMNYDVREQ